MECKPGSEIYHHSVFFSDRYECALKSGQNTDTKLALNILEKLRNPRNLLMAVGLAQLLELYVHASMMSQHSQRFPTQAWAVVIEVKEQVQALSDK